MANSLPQVQFQATNTLNGSPDQTSFVQELHAALQGGTAVYDFFSGDMSALNDVVQQITTNGDSAWQLASQGSSLGYDFLDPNAPVHYVTGGKGTLLVQVLVDPTVLGEETTEYKQAGIATTFLVTSQGLVSIIVNDIEKVGAAIASIAIAPAVLTILGAFKNFLLSYLTRAYNAITGGATDSAAVSTEAAEGAAEDAAVDGEVVGDEFVLSLSFSSVAVAGIAVAAVVAVIVLILLFLSKTMYCLIKFYNYTNQTLSLAMCYENDLLAKVVPQTGTVPPIGTAPAPPGVRPLDSVIYRADYQFQNDISISGLGVIIHGDGSGDFPGMTMVIDIPSVGDNSLYVDLNDTEDWDQLYQEIDSGSYRQLTMSVSNPKYRLSIATNQLDGESPSPITGETGYYYEYLVLIEEGSF
jgi:hypothetical protein